MSSEWLRIMLDEIARKKAAADAERAELERRHMAPDGVRSGGTSPDATAHAPALERPASSEEPPTAPPVLPGGAPRRRLTGPP